MTSGTLRANQGSGGISGYWRSARIFVCSALALIGTLALSTSAMAQCDLNPNNGVQVDMVDLSPADNCYFLDTIPTGSGGYSISPEPNSGAISSSDCFLFWSLDPNADGTPGTVLDSFPISICCDGSGTVNSGDTIYIYADDDGLTDALSTTSSVGYSVVLIDDNPPVVSSASCGATYDLFSDSTYVLYPSTGPMGLTISSADPPLPISDALPPTTATINSPVVGTIGTNVIIDYAQIDLDHTFDGDLEITLISPMGTPLVLSDNNGGSGDDFENTIFMDGAPIITGGTAPYNGTFGPEGGPMNALFNGEPSNGLWTLSILDIFAGDDGTLFDFTMNFMGGVDSLVGTANAGPAICGTVIDSFPVPVFDGCTIDSIVMCFSAGTPAPDMVPDPIVLPVMASSGTYWVEDITLYSSTTGCGAQTVAMIKAYDNSGNVDSSCVITFNVTDADSPSVTVPAGVYVVSTTDSTCTHIVPDDQYDITMIDENCAIEDTFAIINAVDVDINTLAGYELDIDTNDIYWVVTDFCGLSDTSDLIRIIVNDSVAPVIVCATPPDSVGTSEDGLGLYDCFYTAAMEFDPDSVFDNCFIDSVWHNYAFAPFDTTLAGANFPKGSTDVRWYITDSVGNIDSCDITIVVYDDEAPMILDVCPSYDTIYAFDNDCTPLYAWTLPDSFIDNCEIIRVTTEVFDEDGNDLPYILSDPDSCSTVGFMGDFEPGNWTFQMASGGAGAGILDVTDAPNSVTIGAEVASQWALTIIAPNTGVVFANWAHDSEYEPTERVGYYVGTFPPAIPFNIVEFFDPLTTIAGISEGSVAIPVSAGDTLNFIVRNGPGFPFDNDTVSLTLSNFQFLCNTAGYAAELPLGTNTIRTIIEGCGGLTDTCDQYVTVLDTIPPVAACNADTQQVLLSNGGWLEPDDLDDGNSFDGCGPVETMVSKDSMSWAESIQYGCDELGVQVAYLQVTDSSGNVSVCTAYINVQDDVDPVIVGDVYTIALDTAGMAVITDISVLIDTAYDNCDSLTITAAPLAFDCGDLGLNGVSLTATDGSGNQGFGNATVNVVDNLAPVVEGCPADIDTVVLSACEITLGWDAPTVTDNCGTVNGIQIPSNPDVFDVGTTTVTYVWEDGSGNLATCQFEVTVDDGDIPDIACDDLTFSLDECGSAFVDRFNDDAVANDNGCGIDYFSYSLNGGPDFADTLWLDCHDLGVNTLAITAHDNAGNTVTCVQNLTLIDEIAPQIECPVDVTVGTESTADTTDCMGMITSTLTYLDCPATLFPGQYTDNDTCNLVLYYVAVDEDGAQFYSNVAYGTEGIDFSTFTFPLGVNTVSITITDGAGLSDSCSFLVTVVDDTDPVIVCAPDASFGTGDDGNYDCFFTMAGTGLDPVLTFDNCGIESVTHDYVSAPSNTTLMGASFPAGVTVVTWTIVDSFGNSASCMTTIDVDDDQDPMLTCPDDQFRTTSEDGLGLYDCAYTVQGTEFDATAFDNCVLASLTHDYASAPSNTTLDGAVIPVGDTTITWTAVDTAGNTVMCSFNVEVGDDEAPLFPSDCPADIVVNNTTNDCDQDVSWIPPYDWVDNCAVVAVVEEFSDASINPLIPYNWLNTGTMQIAQFPVGTTTVSYTATDASGNATTCSFNVTVLDTQEPEITDCTDRVIESICPEAVVPDYWNEGIDVIDNCDATTILTQDPPAGTTLGDLGIALADGSTFEVTVIATDAYPNGGADTCTFTVTLEESNIPYPLVGVPGGQLQPVQDTSCGFAPVTIYAPQALDLNGCAGDPDTINAIATPDFDQWTDNGDGSYTITGTGNFIVVWYYEDDNGNSTTQLQQISVIDDPEPPVAVCQDITVYYDEDGVASITPAEVDGGSTDNCGISDLSLSGSTFSCSGESVPFINEFHYDNSGTDEGEFVEVAGPAGMDLTGYSIYLYNGNGGAHYDIISLDGLVIDDEGDGSGAVYVAADGAQNGSPDGLALVYADSDVAEFLSYEGAFMATSGPASGMMSTDVGVSESSSTPVGESLQRTGSGTVPGDFSWTGPVAQSPGSLNAGQTVMAFAGDMVVLTVTDLNGNTDDCVVNVTGIDTIPPSVVCVDATVSLDANGDGSIELGDVYTDADDNCEVVSITASEVDFNCDDLGANTVTVTVTDASGLQTSCDATVTVVDEIAPTAVCQDVTVQLDVNGVGSTSTAAVDNGSSDNCTITSMSLSQSTFGCADVGDNTVILTVTDQSGNSDTCSATVTVEDNVAPVFTTCPAPVVSCDASQVLASSATDACGIATITWTITGASNASGTGYIIDYKFAPGTSTVVWTATDVNGNSTTCTTVVTITDALPPVAICIDDLNVTLGLDGTVTLPAHVFDGASFDIGCDPALPLTFYIKVNGGDRESSHTFDCSEVGTNVIELIVVDAACNEASCFTTVDIQDNHDVCPDPAIVVENVSGDIGDTLCVPVNAYDFVDIEGVQFSLHVVDATIAEVIGVEAGLIDPVVGGSGNDLTISWFGTPVTADGEALFCVQVVLVGGIGDVASVEIDGDPTAIEVTQGGDLVDVETTNGFVTIVGGPDMITLAGNVSREFGDPVEDVTVDLSGDDTQTTTTDSDGDYEFTTAPGFTGTITPTRDIEYDEYVSVLDLLMIQLHVLTLDTLDTPYKLIAADASGEGDISTFDLVLLQAILTGTLTDLPGVPSWWFFPEGTTFSDPTNPWADQPWDNAIDVIGAATNVDDLNFIAVKVGDVSYETDDDAANAAETRGAMILDVDNKSVKAGQEVSINVKANDFNEVAAYQLSLNVGTDLEFVGINEEANLASFANSERGFVNVTWFDAFGKTLENGETVFTLTFKATNDISDLSDVVSLSNTLNPIAVRTNRDVLTLGIEFGEIAFENYEFVLFQNRPNPFNGTTVIPFELPESMNASIEILDQTGKVIRVIDGNFAKGRNEVSVDMSGATASGVYYYRLITNDNTAVKSMIITE